MKERERFRDKFNQNLRMTMSRDNKDGGGLGSTREYNQYLKIVEELTWNSLSIRIHDLVFHNFPIIVVIIIKTDANS